MDLSKLSDDQLLELKSSGGDLSRLSDATLMALKSLAPAAPSTHQGMQDAFSNGVFQGFGDELGAAVRATVAPVVAPIYRNAPAWMKAPGDKISGASEAPTWNERYTEELTKARDQAKQFAQDSPGLAATSGIVGNVAGTAPLFAAAPGLTSMGPSLVANVAKLGAVGGVTGAVQGFGEGEGFDDRATNALTHGGLGLAIGGAIPIAGAAGRQLAEQSWTGIPWLTEKVISPLARKLAGNAPKSLSAAAPDGSAGMPSALGEFADRTGNVAQTGAVDRLTTALQRSGLTPSQIEAKLKGLGPEAMLADVDPQFLSAARSANTLPGQTKSVSKNVLEGRDRQAGGRLTSAFEGSEPPPSAYALRGEGQAFDKNVSAVGERAYGAMDAEKLNLSAEMQDVMRRRPIVQEALKQIEADAAHTGAQKNAIQIADEVKQYLNKQADAAIAGGKVINKADIADAAAEFEKAFWKANPKAQEASTAYRQAKSLPEHFDVGAALLTREGTSEPALEKSAARLTDMLAKADPQQKLAARTGATNAARNQAQESTSLARALARRVDESAPVQSKLADLYGPEWAGRISKQAAAEKEFANTSNEILRGSKTADKAAEAMLDTNAGIRVTPSGAVPRFIQHLKDIPEMLVKPNEAVRDAIGRATLNMDPSEKARLVRLIAQNLQRRQQGSPLAASIAGSSGSTIPSNR
jgi:hypothetical protein